MGQQLGALQTTADTLESKQITKDYFYTNDHELVLAPNANLLLDSFAVPSGEVLDLRVNVTTDAEGRNNGL